MKKSVVYIKQFAFFMHCNQYDKDEILKSDPLQNETNKTIKKHASTAARKEYRHSYMIHKHEDSNYRELEKQTQRQYMKYKRSDKILDKG